MKSLIIYIPGLGNQGILDYQRNIIEGWKSETRDVVFLEAEWNDDETYQKKLKRLIKDTEQKIANKYDGVVIVGSSAGGSLAINLFAKLKLKHKNLRCVCISGKLKRPAPIGRKYSHPNPALVDCVTASQKAIKSFGEDDKKKILTMGPLIDEVVAIKDMKIAGVKHKIIPIVGHVLGIGFALKFKTKHIFAH